MRYLLPAMITVLTLTLPQGVSAQTCSGATWCGQYDQQSGNCDCANQLLDRHDCQAVAGACGEYNCESDPGACWCSATCGWTGGGGGGGGSSCPGECRAVDANKFDSNKLFRVTIITRNRSGDFSRFFAAIQTTEVVTTVNRFMLITSVMDKPYAPPCHPEGACFSRPKGLG